MIRARSARQSVRLGVLIPLGLLVGLLPVLFREGIDPKPPKQPHEFFHQQRAWPAHDIPAGAYAGALTEARALSAESLRSSGSTWQPSGPTNVGGRITGMAIDPNDLDRIFIGAADGGVFRSTDAGDSWTPLLDDFGGLSIGAVAHHPTLSDIVLAGTGEANGSGDSYDGIGLLKTTDGGDTWAVAGLENSQRIARVAYDPASPSTIHVAASGGLYTKGNDRGIYRSTDGGDSWYQTLFVSDSTSAIDVVVNPSDPSIVYAAFWERLRGPGVRSVAGPTSGVWKSTDGGDSWAPSTNGLPSGNSVGRIGLALAPTSPSTVYAIYADTPGYFDGVYRTTNAGTSWSRIDDGSDLSNLYSSFGWYFGNIRVSPTNANVLYALGVTLYRSTNGGMDWNNVTSTQHVDFHALWINPANGSHVRTGTDGGFYESYTGTGSWSKKNTLPITQFYAITVDPQLPERIYGGTQDNSTPRTLTGALDDWDVLIGGDGFTVVIDPTDSDIVYGEAQFGWLRKSTNGGSSFFTVLDGVSGSDRVNWHMPFVMDPGDHETLYLGTHRVYKTTDGADYWNAISPDLTDGPGSGNLTFGTLTTLAVAPSAPNTIYTGSDDGNVHVTTNGSTWSEIDSGLPVRYITRVAVDPYDDATAYVTLSGYRLDEFLPHVFRTTDHGASWSDISGNLPQAPVNDLVVDPEYPARLFVATDVGVYVTENLGGYWQVLGSGLPLSVIVDIELHQNPRKIVAGTHGRSSFTLHLKSPPVDVPEIAAADPGGVSLAAPRPNPAQGDVDLSFSMPAGANARLVIYDAAGRRIRTLHEGAAAAGVTRVTWDGRNESDRMVSAGVYFARLTTGGVTRSVKVSRLR